jgi:hypothetical protein
LINDVIFNVRAARDDPSGNALAAPPRSCSSASTGGPTWRRHLGDRAPDRPCAAIRARSFDLTREYTAQRRPTSIEHGGLLVVAAEPRSRRPATALVAARVPERGH